MKDTDLVGFRSRVLASYGASQKVIDEILAYGGRPYRIPDGTLPPELPLADEPHIESWSAYERDARTVGAFPALKRRFVQLRFPIRAGMSQDLRYRAATRRGEFKEAEAFHPGLVLRQPSDLELAVHATMAGRIPVLVVGARDDFISLVRAFLERNEPAQIPQAMGACIISGLNNWDRIATYRRNWERSRSEPVSRRAWAEELRNLTSRKELYQDRFIILSRGPYSAAEAVQVGLEEDEWLRRSLIIRREHEFTHYFTHRVFGAMRNNLLDELVADCVGLTAAFGRYHAELALRFLGLESYPRYRVGGRLETYRGKPSLSNDAFRLLQRTAFCSVRNLENFCHENEHLVRDLAGLAKLTFALAGLSLEELASTEMPIRAGRRLEKFPDES